MNMSKRFAISLVVSLFLCGSVRADLVFDSTYDFQDLPQVSVSSDHESRIADTTGPVHPLIMRGFEPLHLFPEPRYNLDERASVPVHPVQIAADSGQSSLSLCLSALVSLGLCTSMHSMKRLSFGFALQWYHTGGPFQVGHSIAVSLDTDCPVDVSCFVQPVHQDENTVPGHRSITVVSVCKSQLKRDVIASRGPPITC